ncbi:MAG: hypothetical protein ICCCNLDF_01644 [Planctomycetes bacterium]|nr:hypothetical protein [Planctomycetota bacterium]
MAVTGCQVQAHSVPVHFRSARSLGATARHCVLKGDGHQGDCSQLRVNQLATGSGTNCAKACSAALMVASMSRKVWALLTNQASNWLGGR